MEILHSWWNTAGTKSSTALRPQWLQASSSDLSLNERFWETDSQIHSAPCLTPPWSVTVCLPVSTWSGWCYCPPAPLNLYSLRETEELWDVYVFFDFSSAFNTIRPIGGEVEEHAGVHSFGFLDYGLLLAALNTSAYRIVCPILWSAAPVSQLFFPSSSPCIHLILLTTLNSAISRSSLMTLWFVGWIQGDDNSDYQMVVDLTLLTGVS